MMVRWTLAKSISISIEMNGFQRLDLGIEGSVLNRGHFENSSSRSKSTKMTNIPARMIEGHDDQLDDCKLQQCRHDRWLPGTTTGPSYLLELATSKLDCPSTATYSPAYRPHTPKPGHHVNQVY